MALITPNTRILEDGTEELLQSDENAQVIEEGVEYASLNEDTAPAEKPAKEEPAAKEEPVVEETDELPAALKGKTPSQLAKMYADAQALIGRQGQELGSYRTRFDQYIQADLAARTAAAKAATAPKDDAKPTTEEDDDATFFAKPKDAVAKAIENHPLIKKIQETLGTTERDRAVASMKANEAKFYEVHPDAGDIVQDPAFVEWVQASPIRQQLMKQAHTRYDFVAGNEVLATWKALQGVKAKAEPVVDAAAAASAAAATLAKRKATLKAAGVPTAGNGGGQQAPKAGQSSGKFFRRADILDLMENNPERYEALSDEIALAYAEKRVR